MREQRFLGKALGAVAQGIGEVLDKGAAAGGAGFVQQYDMINKSVPKIIVIMEDT